MDKAVFLVMFSDCKLTKGYSRTLATDISRGKTYVLENDAFDFIMKCENESYEQVFLTYQQEEQLAIKELVQFLLDRDLIFFTTSPQSFPPISEKWDSPSIISNAIIDVEYTLHDFKRIIPEFTAVGCYDIQIRFFQSFDFLIIEELIEYISSTSVKSVEFYLKSSPDLTKKALKNLTKRFFKIKNIIVHSHKVNEAYIVYSEKFRNNMGNIIFIRQLINDESHCGQVSTHYFVQDNLQFYNEGLKFNSCLNKKLSIDKNGNIKNCPSMKIGFGNYHDISVNEVLKIEDFSKLWNLSKDKINICKVCEFRNMCTDCRAYVEDPDDILSKPLKCNYDPYTATWAN